MNTHPINAEKLSDVIQVMLAGIDFYRQATEALGDQSLQTTFRKIITHKQSAIDLLQPLVVVKLGERETGTNQCIDARKLYTKIAGKFSSNEAFTYVNQLEEVEDKVLEVLDDALSYGQSPVAELALRNILKDAKNIHNEMRILQDEVKS